MYRLLRIVPILLAMSPGCWSETAAETGEGADSCVVYPDTYYTLTSQKKTNLATSIPKNEKDVVTTADVVHTIPLGNDFEKWSFQKAPFSRVQALAYAIINKHTGLALTVKDDSTEDSSPFILEKYTGRKSQLFQLEAKSRACLVKAVHSGKFLSSGETEIPSSVIQWSFNDDNGLWKINEQSCDPFPNQPYRIIHRPSNLVVGIPDAKTGDDEVLKLMHKDEKADYAQVTFEKFQGSPDVFHIYLRHSGKVFNVFGKRKDRGAALIQFHFSDSLNEAFLSEPKDDGSCTFRAIHSFRFISPERDSGGNFVIGSRLVQSFLTPTLDDTFNLEHTGLMPRKDQTYRIRNIKSDKYLEVDLASIASGTPIVQRLHDPLAQHQLWSFTHHRTNVYSICAIHSKMCIKIGEDDQTAATQQPSASGDQHLFTLKSIGSAVKLPGHIYKIQSLYKGLVLKPIGDHDEDRSRITAGKPTLSDKAQEWEIEPDV